MCCICYILFFKSGSVYFYIPVPSGAPTETCVKSIIPTLFTKGVESKKIFILDDKTGGNEKLNSLRNSKWWHMHSVEVFIYSSFLLVQCTMSLGTHIIKKDIKSIDKWKD